jgi:hypothetical protein
MKQITQYAVVQHSAFGYAGDPRFEAGLETRAVTPAVAARVRAAGGLLFDDYLEAESFCDREMYPPEATGLTPAAPGRFSRAAVDRLRVYVPPEGTACAPTAEPPEAACPS